MRINNSFSNSFPIIASNGEFSAMMTSNALSNMTIKLVDANGQKIHLLSPMYLSAIAHAVVVEDSPLVLQSAGSVSTGSAGAAPSEDADS